MGIRVSGMARGFGVDYCGMGLVWKTNSSEHLRITRLVDARAVDPTELLKSRPPDMSLATEAEE